MNDKNHRARDLLHRLPLFLRNAMPRDALMRKKSGEEVALSSMTALAANLASTHVPSSEL
jgi:hypothetical protein